MTIAPIEPRELSPPASLLDSAEAGRRFLRGGSLRLVAYGAGVLASLASVPLVARHLKPENWGHYLTVTSLLFIVQALTEGGVANVGVRQFSTSGAAQRRELMRDLLGLRLALTLVGVAAALAFSLIAGYSRVLVEGTAIAGVGLLLLNLQYTLTVPLMADLRLGWQAVNDFLGQLMTALGMIALVLAGATLLPFYAVSSLAAATTLALTVRLVRRQVFFRPSFHAARWRALLSESAIYAAATALGAVYFRIVILAMSLISTALQTGYFSLSFRVLDVVNAVPWLLVTSAFPILARAARDDEQRLRYALQRLFDGGLVLGGWFALCLVAGAPFAIAVVGGPSYHASVELLRILGAGIPATFLLATWSFALLSLQRYRQLVVVNGLIVLAAVGLSAGLIRADDATGAALATISLEVLLAGGYLLALTRNRPELRPQLGRVPRIVLAFVLAFVPVVVLRNHSVLATVAGSCVLLVALLLLHAIPDEILIALRERRAPAGSSTPPPSTPPGGR